MEKNNGERGDIYLLGGNDAEMDYIKKKLDKNDQEYIDKKLGWGADIGAYNEEITNILQNGDTPVGIELTGADKIEGVVDIDHHNEKAYMPAAITQVMERLGLKMSLYDELIAANDSGFIPEMEKRIDQEKERITKKLGEEGFEKVKKKLIENVRQKDRLAQGITKEQEEQAEESIKNREDYYNGNLTIIRLPHSKGATVTDRLYGTYKNLLILSEDGEINFYGDGEMCQKLKDENEGSWAGGEGLGEKGGNAFWGGYVDQKELEEDIRYRIKEKIAHEEVIKIARTEDEYRSGKKCYINSISDNEDLAKKESVKTTNTNDFELNSNEQKDKTGGLFKSHPAPKEMTDLEKKSAEEKIDFIEHNGDKKFRFDPKNSDSQIFESEIYEQGGKYYKINTTKEKELLEKAHTETYFRTVYMKGEVKETKYISAVYGEKIVKITKNVSEIQNTEYENLINLDKILNNIPSNMKNAIKSELDNFGGNIIKFSYGGAGIDPVRSSGHCGILINGKDYSESWSGQLQSNVLERKYKTILSKLQLREKNVSK